MSKLVNKEDLDALWEYHDGPAQNYHSMSYADGLRDIIEWLDGGPRPDQEDEE